MIPLQKVIYRGFGCIDIRRSASQGVAIMLHQMAPKYLWIQPSFVGVFAGESTIRIRVVYYCRRNSYN
jgi:hypothetical protein